MHVTERQMKQINQQMADFEWLEVTVYGDKERMFLLATPRCAYCGRPDPTGKCASCGASVLRDGWR